MMEDKDKFFLAFMEVKLMQDLMKLEEERWFTENFYGEKIPDNEWNEYANKKLNNIK